MIRVVALGLSAVTLWGATVRVQVGSVIKEMPLESYTAAVVAGEAGIFRSAEALKAMAVAARSYGVYMRDRHAAEGFDLCSTTHCQRLDEKAITPRVQAAAVETRGELIWFEGMPAFAVYSQDCGGEAEFGGRVWPGKSLPYLSRHADSYCVRNALAWRWSGSREQIQSALSAEQLHSPRRIEGIRILERTESGRAATLLLTGGGESVKIAAGSFRFAIGRQLGWNTVRSDLYEIEVRGAQFVFVGKGGGHGVGLCQRGADEMGMAGKTWKEILSFYYPGAVVSRRGAGLAWQEMSSRHVKWRTTKPAMEPGGLQLAERLVGSLAQRTKWGTPESIAISVYPSVDTFRNATGEPGWVAAHTEGAEIALQPTSVLRSRGVLESVLLHELSHVFVELNGAANLPLWFREGMAQYLSGEHGRPRAGTPTDADLSGTNGEASARAAYQSAAAMVEHLVRRYSESVVLGWVLRGVPVEATRASSMPSRTNNR